MIPVRFEWVKLRETLVSAIVCLITYGARRAKLSLCELVIENFEFVLLVED